ncbi:DUF6328 family protein [Okibacterium endophyticum]
MQGSHDHRDHAAGEEPTPHTHDAVRDERDETPSERYDRNWKDLLQELRVLQAGTQILTAFLLAIAFQPRFDELDEFQIVLYLALLSASTLATALSIAPVVLHRALFRRRMKMVTVAFGDLLLRAAFICVSLTMIGTIMLVFDFVVSRRAGIVGAVVTAVVILLLALVVPFAARRSSEPDRQAGGASPRH